MCCARAIVTAKAKIYGHEQWNSIRQSRRIQEELALELHTKANNTESLIIRHCAFSFIVIVCYKKSKVLSRRVLGSVIFKL
jgi:hypothetical protein